MPQNTISLGAEQQWTPALAPHLPVPTHSFSLAAVKIMKNVTIFQNILFRQWKLACDGHKKHLQIPSVPEENTKHHKNCSPLRHQVSWFHWGWCILVLFLLQTHTWRKTLKIWLFEVTIWPPGLRDHHRVMNQGILLLQRRFCTKLYYPDTWRL